MQNLTRGIDEPFCICHNLPHTMPPKAGADKGRPLKLSPAEHQQLINDLVENKQTQDALSKKYGIAPNTVKNIEKRFCVVIQEQRKVIVQSSQRHFSEDLATFSKQAGETLLAGIKEMTKDKLAKCSAPQLAMVCGILFDKLSRMEARLGEVTISTRFESRREMLAYIQHGEGGEQAPRQAVPVPEDETQVQALQGGEGEATGAMPRQLTQEEAEAGDPPAIEGATPQAEAAGDRTQPAEDTLPVQGQAGQAPTAQGEQGDAPDGENHLNGDSGPNGGNKENNGR